MPLLLSACVKTEEFRGYTFEESNVTKIQLGNSKEDVMRVLGSPSSKTSFGKDTWFYIASKTERVAFLNGKTIEQKILAVEFNETGYITAINHYNLADANHVQFVKDATPTEGSDTSAVGQILGNVGRFNPAGGGPSPRTAPH